MRKRIVSLFLSVSLIIICILALNDSAVVEACDNTVLLEKRQPGYWNWLHDNAVNVDTDQDGEKDTTIYPISKSCLTEISYDDYGIYKRLTKTNTGSITKKIVYFFDGTGIDLTTLLYGEINPGSLNVDKAIGTIQDNGGYLSLASSKKKSVFGINGIDSVDVPINQITDLYQYLMKLQNMEYSFVISALDETSLYWNEKLQYLIKQLGLSGGFGWRDSYLAVVDHGDVVDESVNHEFIEYSSDINGLYVVSAGGDTGKNSSIKINGVECSKQQRGLNIVVLEGSQVVDSVNFDTYQWNLPCYR